MMKCLARFIAAAVPLVASALLAFGELGANPGAGVLLEGDDQAMTVERWQYLDATDAEHLDINLSTASHAAMPVRKDNFRALQIDVEPASDWIILPYPSSYPHANVASQNSPAPAVGMRMLPVADVSQDNQKTKPAIYQFSYGGMKEDVAEGWSHAALPAFSTFSALPTTDAEIRPATRYRF